MARPTPNAIASGQQSWDVDVNDNLDLAGIGSDPMMAPEFANEGALPPAASWDRCIAVVNNTDSGWTAYISDGTNWIPLVKQAVAVSNLGQNISATYQEAEVQAISDKVDEFLDALRASGGIDT